MRPYIGFLLLILLSVLLFTFCTDEQAANADSADYFSHHLKADMTFREIVKAFGEPDADIGSGIHIYVYTLEDSTEIRIGFADRILYATHLDRDHRVLKILI